MFGPGVDDADLRSLAGAGGGRTFSADRRCASLGMSVPLGGPPRSTDPARRSRGDHRGVAADRDSLSSRRTTGVEIGAAPASPRLLCRRTPPRCEPTPRRQRQAGRRTIVPERIEGGRRLAASPSGNGGDAPIAPLSPPFRRDEDPAKGVTGGAAKPIRGGVRGPKGTRLGRSRSQPPAERARRSRHPLGCSARSSFDSARARTTVTLNLDSRSRYWARGPLRF